MYGCVKIRELECLVQKVWYKSFGSNFYSFGPKKSEKAVIWDDNYLLDNNGIAIITK